MACRLLLIAIVLLAGTTSTFAGIHGILTGKVTDKDGQPVSGATIRVMGTNRGAIAKSDGKYTIVNITAGEYTVRVTAIGYDTLSEKVSLIADQTRIVNFKLTQGGVLKQDVVITADREMVRSTDQGTDRVSKGKDLVKMGLDNVASAISLSAGITASGNNFVVRGSRTDETQVLVDGLTVTDLFTGGLGNSGSTISAAMPSPLATEEVQAKTGGFGAEYGNAVGGIVNTVVKTGHTDRFDGTLRYRTDVPMLWGNANNGIEAGTPKEDVIDVAIGGPLGLGRSTFFISLRNNYQNYRNFGLQVMDPWGNNLGEMPNNRTWGRNITGRLKFQVTNDVALLVGGMFGILNGERTSQGWLYATNPGIVVDQYGNPILDGAGNVQNTGMIERMAKQIVVQEFSSNAFAQINQVIGSSTAYELRASFNEKVTETGRRINGDAPNPFTGWELWYPTDTWQIGNDAKGNAMYAQTGPNAILDPYELMRVKGTTEDNLVEMELSKRNPLTGFVEGPGDALSTRNPYGLLGYFYDLGNEGGVDFRRATYWQVDGNITHSLEVGDTRHVLKGGFELRLQTLARHSNGNPWDGNPFYDVYGADYGGNLYGTAAARLQSDNPFKPVTGAIYVQDQIIFKGLVFTPGFRLDYMDPNSLYRTSSAVFIPIDSLNQFAQVKPKLYISPRITITYPVSDNGRQNFKLSYGIYYQQPPWTNFFDSFNTSNLRPSSLLGNPNLEMQRTNQYEISYNHQLSDYFALTLTGYYKDIYNQTDIAYVQALPTPFYQTVMSGYGNNRGLEMTFEKMLNNHWGFQLNYTIAQATGTANNSTTIVAIDPYTNNPAFPVEPFALGFDRRHRINAVFNLNWGPDEGPTIAGIPFLENFNINLSGFWQTGLPYTPVNQQGQAIGAINSARFPSTWNTTFRIVRTIPLDKLLGGKTAVDLFFDVTNLLNYTGAVSFYTRTGSPDNDGFGLNRVEGDFPSTTYFKEGDRTNKYTTSLDQYDRVGRRRYNESVDFNHDGAVSPAETYQGYRQYVANYVDGRRNYQYPRQVYFGITFRF
ncbi:MAG: TonB-dependent receptor [Bradyrhizobiaceae bacterium]|nr:TonB-dependent receptor [Bradyrhizobiaceae bacterium]